MTLDWDISLLCHLVAVTLPFLQSRSTTRRPALRWRHVKVGEMHTRCFNVSGRSAPATLQGSVGFCDDRLVTVVKGSQSTCGPSGRPHENLRITPSP